MAGARVLFTCRPLAGHFEPLVPLATAAKQAGHVVAFATGEPYEERARGAGFEAFRVGPSEGFRAEWAPRFAGFERLVGDEQRRFFLTEIFANLELEPRATDLEAVVDAWAPDLVVHEVELGRDSYVPDHRFLSDDEAFEVGAGFRRDHPHRLRLLTTVLGWGDLDDDEAVRQFVRNHPFVAFRPTTAIAAD